jgi:NTE family protein
MSKKVGLALGGGAARGLAHVGVVSALVEAGVQIDFVSGCSVGSIVGALYAAGFYVAELQYVASRFRWTQAAHLVWPRRGLVSFEKLESIMSVLLADAEFSDLELPFAAAATDMSTGEPVTLCSGKVAAAVHASCAVPGLVQPRMIDGRPLADGAMTNNIPVGVLRDMGADLVIGVDIFEPTFSHPLGALGMAITAAEILVARAGGGFEDADVMIRPMLAGRSYVRFAHDDLIQRGRDATMVALPRIKKALSGS